MRIRELLLQIEEEMRLLGIWSEQPPPPDAFASTAPFCHDRMSFDQWMRWVLIPRMNALVDQKAPLPAHCGIAPLAKLAFAEQHAGRMHRLISLISELDDLIENGDH